MLRLGKARLVEACKLQSGPSSTVLGRMLWHSGSVVSREGWKRGVSGGLTGLITPTMPKLMQEPGAEQ